MPACCLRLQLDSRQTGNSLNSSRTPTRNDDSAKVFPSLLAALVLCTAQHAAAADCLDLPSTALSSAGGRPAANVAPSSIDGKPTIRVTPGTTATDGLVILPLDEFRDGEIRITLWSTLRPDASSNARGFAGLAFRIAADAKAFEYFYVRPGIARAAGCRPRLDARTAGMRA